MNTKTVLITGAGGYIGGLVTKELASRGHIVLATDIAPVDFNGVASFALDVRGEGLHDLIVDRKVDVVVHLAAILSPKDDDFAYSVDVEGTRNVLDACIKAGSAKVIISSSGAAYGYHADNDALLTEDSPIRGNDEFAYSRHKRIVEEMLAEYRDKHPELGQLIFRLCTVLGPTVSNQITDIFEKPVVLGLSDYATPFCFIWDKDVVGCIVRGVETDGTGIYNVAGDGVMTLKEVAGRLGKRFIGLPANIVGGALSVLSKYELSQYGPEQVRFLQYRPVLGNDRLKRDFGYRPELTSRQVFDLYADR